MFVSACVGFFTSCVYLHLCSQRVCTVINISHIESDFVNVQDSVGIWKAVYFRLFRILITALFHIRNQRANPGDYTVKPANVQRTFSF